MNKQAEIPTFGVLRDKGWTLRAVAKKLGCCPSHLSRVLSRERSCTRAMANKLNALPQVDRKKEKTLA